MALDISSSELLGAIAAGFAGVWGLLMLERKEHAKTRGDLESARKELAETLKEVARDAVARRELFERALLAERSRSSGGGG